MSSISNAEDIIDSRDVIERIDELRDMRDEWIEAQEEAGFEFDMSPDTDWHNAHTDEGLELDALEALADQARGYVPDWEHGAALISESYFTEYAQQLAEDCGMVDADARWPNTYIDWDGAAEALQQDYTAVDFDGVTYWIR